MLCKKKDFEIILYLLQNHPQLLAIFDARENIFKYIYTELLHTVISNLELNCYWTLIHLGMVPDRELLLKLAKNPKTEDCFFKTLALDCINDMHINPPKEIFLALQHLSNVRLDILELLLRKGFNIEIPELPSGDLILHENLNEKGLTYLKYLQEKNLLTKDILEQENAESATPLEIAAYHLNKETIIFLLEAGVKPINQSRWHYKTIVKDMTIKEYLEKIAIEQEIPINALLKSESCSISLITSRHHGLEPEPDSQILGTAPVINHPSQFELLALEPDPETLDATVSFAHRNRYGFFEHESPGEKFDLKDRVSNNYFYSGVRFSFEGG